MPRSKILTLALAAALVTGSAAMAQNKAPSPAAPTAPEQMQKRATDMKATQVSSDLVGRNLTNARGETLGEIEAVRDDKIIVSVGGFLGIGERKVAIPGEKLSVSGTGDDKRVVVAMSNEELKAMPEYRM